MIEIFRCTHSGAQGRSWPAITNYELQITNYKLGAPIVGNGFIRSVQKRSHAECMNAFPTGAVLVGTHSVSVGDGFPVPHRRHPLVGRRATACFRHGSPIFLRTYSAGVGNGFIRSARKCGYAECINAFPTGAVLVGRVCGPMWSLAPTFAEPVRCLAVGKASPVRGGFWGCGGGL